MSHDERYPLAELADLPEDIRAQIMEVQEKAGFVPNVFLKFARRPNEYRAFFAYHDALMLREGGLSKGGKEMIVVATSARNQCLYCGVAHGALLDFALKVSESSCEIDDSDFARLQAHGFDDEDIWDIGAIAALFGLSNRMANLTDMQPNPEFHLMGRLPKKAG